MIIRLCLLFVGYILFVAFTNVAAVAFSWIYALIFAAGLEPNSALLLIASYLAGAASAISVVWAAWKTVLETERKDEERRQKKAAAKEQAVALAKQVPADQ